MRARLARQAKAGDGYVTAVFIVGAVAKMTRAVR